MANDTRQEEIAAARRVFRHIIGCSGADAKFIVPKRLRQLSKHKGKG